MTDDFRERIAWRIQQEAVFETDMKAIRAIAAATGTELEKGWQDKALHDFEEMLDAKIGCPKGCLAVWKETDEN